MNANRNRSLEEIKNMVEKMTGIKIDKKTRERDIVIARSIYYYFARKYTRESLQKITEMVGRNHSTLYNAIEKLPIHMEYDPFFKDVFEKIQDKFKQKKDGLIISAVQLNKSDPFLYRDF